MSTWHQNRNKAGLTALWQPHPTHWKCVSDKYGQCASSMTFENEQQARAYAARTGDAIIPPHDPRLPVSSRTD